MYVCVEETDKDHRVQLDERMIHTGIKPATLALSASHLNSLSLYIHICIQNRIMELAELVGTHIKMVSLL